MSQKLWVAHATTAKTFIDKVSIQGCEDIADFLKEIKKEFEIPGPSSHLTLYKSDGTTELKPTDTIKSLGNIGKDADAPLVVKTTAIGKSSSDASRLEAEIAALYALLDKEELSKSEQYKVDNFEKELTRLDDRYNTLVTALATAPRTQGTFNL